MKKKREEMGNKGFSLIEIIVVIAIMAILVAAIAPQFMRYIEKSRESMDDQATDQVVSSVKATLANETAWDDIGDSGSTIVVTADGTATYTDFKDPLKNFTDEFTSNLPKIPKMKSKLWNAGYTIKIEANKEITLTNPNDTDNDGKVDKK